MKNGKATGSIYNTGNIPTELEKSIFITILKKAKVHDYIEFRTISLMSHVTKTLLKIIQKRIANEIDQECSNLQMQSGFRPGIGTRVGIFNSQTILERAIKVQQDACIYVLLSIRKPSIELTIPS